MIYIIGYSTNPKFEILLARCDEQYYDEEHAIMTYKFTSAEIYTNIGWEFYYEDQEYYEERDSTVDEFNSLVEAQKELLMRILS